MLYDHVFIVGAGASCPFGLPTGLHLRTLLTSKGPPSSLNYFYQIPRFRREVETFQREFLESGIESIDLFLHFRREHAEIGKILIAGHLLELEESALNRTEKSGPLKPVTDDWISYLYNRFLACYGDVDHWPVCFVTFNYDRLIEASLALMRASTFKKPFDECLNFVSENLSIVHVYGNFGTKIHYLHNGDRRIDCKSNVPDVISRAAEGIKTLFDDREGLKDEYGEIPKNSVLHSKHRVLLGFGFDPQNCKILGLGKGHGHELDGKWVCTAFGLKKRERDSILECTMPNIHIGSNDQDCLSVMREYISF